MGDSQYRTSPISSPPAFLSTPRFSPIAKPLSGAPRSDGTNTSDSEDDDFEESSEMEGDTSSNSTGDDKCSDGYDEDDPVGRQHRRRRKRFSAARRLDRTLRFWKDNFGPNMTIGQFIKDWVTVDVPGRRTLRRFPDNKVQFDIKQRRLHYLRRALRQRAVRKVFPDSRNDLCTRELLKELDGLVSKPFFNHFTQNTSIEDVNFDTAFTSIQSDAPQWFGLIQQLLQNQRAEQPSARKRGVQFIYEAKDILHHLYYQPLSCNASSRLLF